MLLLVTMREEVALSLGDNQMTIKATHENNSLHGYKMFLEWT